MMMKTSTAGLLLFFCLSAGAIECVPEQPEPEKATEEATIPEPAIYPLDDGFLGLVCTASGEPEFPHDCLNPLGEAVMCAETHEGLVQCFRDEEAQERIENMKRFKAEFGL